MEHQAFAALTAPRGGERMRLAGRAGLRGGIAARLLAATPLPPPDPPPARVWLWLWPWLVTLTRRQTP